MILAGGLALAGLIYVLAPPPRSPRDDPSLYEYYDKQDRFAREMWGNSGPLLTSLVESLKHIRTYSFMVAGCSIATSLACFYFSMEQHSSHE